MPNVPKRAKPPVNTRAMTTTKTSPTTTTTAEALLGLLSFGPMTGFEMRRHIAASVGHFWGESFGQIYPALARLEAAGAIAAAPAPGDAGRTKRYALTAAGRRRLREWLRQPFRPRVPRNELLLKLFFGSECDVAQSRAQLTAALTLYRGHLDRYEAITAEMAACPTPDAPGHPFWAITLAYGVAEARAVVAWAEQSLAALDALPARSPAPPPPKPRTR